MDCRARTGHHGVAHQFAAANSTSPVSEPLLPATTALTSAADRANLWGGSLLTVCAAVSFGVITTFGRLAYDGGSNPLTVVLLRHVLFVALVGALLLVLRRRCRLSPKALLATLWMSMTLTMMSLGYLGSVAFIPVNLAALIFYTNPLLVGVLAAAAGREQMTIAKAAALLVAFMGLSLALGPGFESLDPRGIACALTAALGAALTIAFYGQAMRGQDTLTITFYTNLWTLIGLMVYLAASGGFALPKTALGVIGTGGVGLCYVVAFLTWFLAGRLAGPVRIAALMNIEPLVSIFAAWLLLGERLAPVQIIGACLVLGSILAITLSGIRRPRSPARQD